jgi:hypothetical protein
MIEIKLTARVKEQLQHLQREAQKIQDAQNALLSGIALNDERYDPEMYHLNIDTQKGVLILQDIPKETEQPNAAKGKQ